MAIKGLPVAIKISYQQPKDKDRDDSEAYLYIADVDPKNSVRQESMAILDSDGVERGNINIDLDTNGRILGIKVLGAQSILPKRFLNQIWTVLSSYEVRNRMPMDKEEQIDHAITFILSSAAHSNWEIVVQDDDNMMIINGHRVGRANVEHSKKAKERMLSQLQYINEVDTCRYQVTEAGKESQRERHGR